MHCLVQSNFKKIEYTHSIGCIASEYMCMHNIIGLEEQHRTNKKGNAKECSNYLTIALISHTTKAQNSPSQALAICEP